MIGKKSAAFLCFVLLLLANYSWAEPSSTVRLSGSLPKAYTVSGFYSQSVLASGGQGDYTFSIASGDLPPGFYIRQDDNRFFVEGIPNTPGTWPFSLRVTDRHSSSASRELSLTVDGESYEAEDMTLSGDFTVSGVTGTFYQGEISVEGGNPEYTFSVDGSLPEGLYIRQDSGQFFLEGVPVEAGDSVFVLRVRDMRNAYAEESFSVSITAGDYTEPEHSDDLTVTGSLDTDIMINGMYSGYAQLEGVDDFPVRWAVVSGDIPPGLSLSPERTHRASGVYISGIPNAGGTYTFTLRGIDAGNKYAQQDFTIRVNESAYQDDNMSITGNFIAEKMINAPYFSRIDTDGASGSFRMSVTSGDVPEGLSLTAGEMCIDLHGIPNTGGTYKFTLGITDSRNAFTERTFTVKINDVPYEGAGMSLIDDLPGEIKVYGTYSGRITAGGFEGSGNDVIWSVVSGEVPPGLSLIPSSSYSSAYIGLEGIPNTGGTYTFTLRETDSRNAYSQRKFTVKVNDTPYSDPAMSITGDFPSDINVMDELKRVVDLSGFDGSGTAVLWSVVSGEIPPGLSLRPASTYRQSSAYIEGIPVQPGTFSFTLRASDIRNAYAQRDFTVTVGGDSPSEASLSETMSLSGVFPDGLTGWYSASVQASGGTEDYTFRITEGELPAGLYIRQDGEYFFLEGVPIAEGTFTFTLRVIDGGNTYAEKTFTVKIDGTHYAADDMSLSGKFPDIYTINPRYSECVRIDGGNPEYTFKVTGTIPPGLYIRHEGGYFWLEGIAYNTGTYTFTLRVTDKRNAYTEKSFTVSVNGSSSDDTEPSQTSGNIEITSGNLPPAGTGQSYSYTLAASGSPSLWSVTSGDLPGGLSLEASSGVISGIVSENAADHNSRTPKSYTFTVTASNVSGDSGAKDFTIDVYESVAITTESLPNAKAGIPYDAQIEASGTYVFSWEFMPKINVPDWLIHSNSDNLNVCKLSGIPDKEGTYTFKAVCGNQYFMADKTFTLIVEPNNDPLTINPAQLPSAATAQEYSYTLTAEGNPSSWSVTSGDLPEGLTLSSDGVISGVVSTNAVEGNSASGKTYTFEVTASNIIRSDTQTFSITVYEPVRIITESLPSVREGSEYSAVIEASGTRLAFGQSVLNPDNIPAGLQADTSEYGKITLSGIPTQEGTYSIRVYFANFWSSADKEFTLTVDAKPVPSAKPQISMPKSCGNIIAGKNYSFQYTASGSTPITWGVTGSLPPGLTFDTSSGKLSGTAQAITEGKSSSLPLSYNFTVTATNAGGVDSADTHITVWYPPEIVTGNTLEAAEVNSSYSAVISAEGTEYSMSWKKSSGNLPKGLTLSMSKNKRTCTITGTPAKKGTYTFTLEVSNYAGKSQKQKFTLTINEASDTGSGKPTIITQSLPEGETGETYSIVLKASGRKPITWSKSGTLPKGLKLDKYGTLSGIPQKAGEYNFTISAKNKEGSAKQNFTVMITGDVYSKPKITTKSIPEASVNQSYSVQLEASGTAPVTWSFDNSKYPSGLYITEDGLITGTPKETGKFSVKVRAENSIGSSTKSFTLKVKGIAPSILNEELSYGICKTQYEDTLIADGTDTITWSKSGSFPRGLKLNKKTGAISGKPTKEGTYSFKITAKNDYGKSTRSFTIRIYKSVSASSIPDDKDSINAPESEHEITEYMTQDYAVEYSLPESLASANNSEIDLCVVSGDEELRGEIYAPEGMPLTFRIGVWPGNYDGAEVYIADEPVAVDVSEGTFILPGELVCDEFVIYVMAGNTKTIELYIVAETEE